ncbi:MAG: Crp/Fnr family transcriptional regulator [Flavobacteriaceae bacterium]|nr:Crp/Fnr family transcriptional regulator [Flavobacteriaceae bacterium]
MSKCENCIIRQFNALRAMSKEELQAISESKEMRNFSKGDILFEEGEKLNGVYCVRNGVSKLSKLSPNGKDQVVRLAAKGEVLGQRSVIVKETTNLSAIALEDMEVCFIPNDHIISSLDKNPQFAKEILRHMAHELKEADNVIVNMSQKTVKQRTAEALLYLKNNFGDDADGFLRLVLSREDIANIIGTATESCIRIISDFKKQKLIQTAGKKIKITDTKGLTQLAKGLSL